VKNTLNPAFLRPAWQFPAVRFLASRQAVILLYHGIPAAGDGTCIDADTFDQHVRFLSRHFEIIHPEQGNAHRKAGERMRVMLTFDDGFRNNAAVVAPILEKYDVPAMFFISSRHATPGRYLWFSYLNALEQEFPDNRLFFRGEFIDLSPSNRASSIKRLRELLLNLRPHPEAMYRAIEEELPALETFVDRDKLSDRFAGLTADHVGQLAQNSLFSIGIHTVDHPVLTKCTAEESYRQIYDNKVWLERISRRRCETIAYPSGSYNSKILEQCRQFRILQGHAVIPQKIAHNSQLELARLGIYSRSIDIVGFKVTWGKFIRQLKVNIG
jgi:peptidoglycan/xylan/chitin deacetylase (PgdA/CDA1 family)